MRPGGRGLTAQLRAWSVKPGVQLELKLEVSHGRRLQVQVGRPHCQNCGNGTVTVTTSLTLLNLSERLRLQQC